MSRGILEEDFSAVQAAWLKSQDGNIATALRHFAKLRTLQDVVVVEPQMLMRRTPRSSGDG